MLDAEFPKSSKSKLDDVRGLVVPTLKGHHYYKACGGRISSSLDMAERMLEHDCILKEVEDLFKQTIEREYRDEGYLLNMEHVKIDGRTLNLGEARMTRLEPESSVLRLSRTFTREGTYDGLKTRKEPGDYAVTDMQLGEWSFQTCYFSKDGTYKGSYINLNTSVEMYPTKIRYVDLEVDICIWPDGRAQQIDREKLDQRISEGYISSSLGQIVTEKTKEILNSLENGDQQIH